MSTEKPSPSNEFAINTFSKLEQNILLVVLFSNPRGESVEEIFKNLSQYSDLMQESVTLEELESILTALVETEVLTITTRKEVLEIVVQSGNFFESKGAKDRLETETTEELATQLYVLSEDVRRFFDEYADQLSKNNT